MFRWEFTLSKTTDASLQDLEIAGFMQTFSTREEAESWLGNMYLDLQDYGVEFVTLYDGDSPLMEPMSLQE